MKHIDRINNLIERIKLSENEYGPEIWNDKPVHNAIVGWMKPKIGSNPQSPLGHTLAMIDDHILYEHMDGLNELLLQMQQCKEQTDPELEQIAKATKYLGIGHYWGFRIFSTNPKLSKNANSREEVILTLENMAETRSLYSF